MKKWMLYTLSGLLVLVLAAAGAGYFTLRSHGFLRAPVFETEPPAVPALSGPAVLVFSKTNRFIHRDAIPAAKTALEAIGAERGWSVYTTDNGAVHNPTDLARFQAVVWNNVTGDVLTAAQRAALRAWIEGGGGFVGLHAAGDDSHSVWPWYQQQVIGARFIGHPMDPQFQFANLQLEDPVDPIMAGIANPWRREDEWYSFESSPRAPGVRVLATLAEDSYVPEQFGKDLRMGADHPVIWKRCIGQGRVFYTALGHTAASYAEPAYLGVLERAVAWAGRLDEANLLPADLALACEHDADGAREAAVTAGE